MRSPEPHRFTDLPAVTRVDISSTAGAQPINSGVTGRSRAVFGSLVAFDDRNPAASGLLIELAGRGQYEKFSGRGAIGLGSIGLLTGLAIDVANKEKATVYVHGPGQQPRAARVFPRVSKSAVSVQISIGF